MRVHLLESGLSEVALDTGLEGFAKLLGAGHIHRDDLLCIIDFSLPSNKERMWILNPVTLEPVHTSLVAHGRNSGNLWARSFSNDPGSYASSLGFYATAENYHGKHGLSLRLDGLEPDFNDKARERAVVMHSADYADPSFVEEHGRLGRSFGCPSIPTQGHEEVLRQIANGVCLYIFAPDEEYLASSPILCGNNL
ncbi:MAG: hypothetical protein EA392_11605 [Cryomorphaceae bacterium]|nr:MAG: hypothetical protein EA392_11605 [Cryomorphaceae bacterium]